MKKTMRTLRDSVFAAEPTSPVVKEKTSTTIKMKVLPRSSSNSIEGLENGEWKVKLTAPPVEGAANTALIHYLSDVLGVPRRFVTIIGGQNSRNKLVQIDGLTAAEVKHKLSIE